MSNVANGKGEVLLPDLGDYKSTNLVILKDKETGKFLLISMNPMKSGGMLLILIMIPSYNNFLKNEDNENFILSHFNKYDVQDGVFKKGATQLLKNVQHGKMVVDSTSSISAVGSRRSPSKWEPALDMKFTTFNQI